MIIDTSALIAILLGEPESAAFIDLLQVNSTAMAAPTYVECAVVIDRHGDAVASRQLDSFIDKAGIAILPFDRQMAMVARDAYRDFGKGSGHPARLNFGDCIAYAMARTRDEPLLFKGDDFPHTDVRPANG